MSLSECHRGYVRPTDCDDMGHMNVARYVARFTEAAQVHLGGFGCAPGGLTVLAQHLRFVRELRTGDLTIIGCGVLAQGGGRLRLVQDLVEGVTGQLAARCETLLACPPGLTPPLCAAPEALARAALLPLADGPEFARRTAAVAAGLFPSHVSLVQPGDCDAAGRLSPEGVMQRISDGQGHLWAAAGCARPVQAARNLGTAAVEYRILYGALPAAQSVVRMSSGLVGRAGKAVRFRHWLFADPADTAIAMADGVAVFFDRASRRAVPVPAEVAAGLAELSSS